MSGHVNLKLYLVPNHKVLVWAGTVACSIPNWHWPSKVTPGPHLASNYRAHVAVSGHLLVRGDTNIGHLLIRGGHLLIRGGKYFCFLLACASLTCPGDCEKVENL